MTTPTHCASCGHELGVGRFCTNCGQPVPGRHPEAAPAAGAPVVPPPTGQLPPAARYPLYADAPTVLPPAPPSAPPGAPGPAPAAITRPVPAPAPAPSAPPPGAPRAGDRSVRRWLPWAIGVLMLALVAGIGTFLLVAAGGDDGERADDDRTGTATDRRTDETEPTRPDPSGRPRPDRTGTTGPVAEPPDDEVSDLTSTARAQVPATAPPSRDRRNRPVTYDAENMLDDRPRTAWRMPGDGTGATLVFDLGEEVVLTEVGLVNGYAKIDGADNWYLGNRRIRVVQWEFDDGTRITQRLTDGRALQSLPVGPVATTRVVLRLVEVTPPGEGPAGRDFTAISDVRLRGAPA